MNIKFYRKIKSFIWKIIFILPISNSFILTLEKISFILQGKGYTTDIGNEVDNCLIILNKTPLIFIDIGANKGNYTRYLLSKYPDLNCHLFEPSQRNFDILKESFYSKDKIRINKLALSDKNGKGNLYSDEPGSFMASLTKRDLKSFGINLDHEIEVNLKRFDNYWEDQNIIIDYVKIDVEGHELDVLNGFGELIKNVRLVQFEFGGTHIDTRIFFRDFWEFFSKHNFTLFRITPSKPLKINQYSEKEEVFQFTNFIALNNKF